MSDESSDRELYDYLSLAIGVICIWLIPQIAIEISEYRFELDRSPAWRDAERREKGNKAISNAALVAVLISVVIFTSSAVSISLFTQGMDWRAQAIVTGLSRITGAIIVFFISYKTPKWLGVYWSNKHDYGEPVGSSIFHLKFNVRWSIWRHFFQVYFITLLFFCGTSSTKIPISALIGITVGFIIYYFIYLGRTKYSHNKEKLAIFMASFISIASAVAFSSGCWYIQLVWGREEKKATTILSVASFFSWLFFEAMVHLVMYRNTLHKTLREAEIPPEQKLAQKYQKQPYIHVVEPETRSKDARGRLVQDEESYIEYPQDDFEVEIDNEYPVEADPKKQSGEVSQKKGISKAQKEEDDDNEHEYSNEELKEGNTMYQKKSLDEKYETVSYLFCLHCCGNAEKSGERREKTPLEIFVSVIKWIIWIGGNALFLFLVILNIGATYQNNVVQRHLQGAFDFIYPHDYNNKTVCAWDNQGSQSNITTFDSPETANAASFSVIHCGACGACSNWNDLSLQWTTRTHLAKDAQNCAKKAFFGGENLVQACNRDGIGFTDDCAWCWTADELCAKKNCLFIFLQGIMINKLTNFEVEPNEITSATCDEALCGPAFVPCSGATRRRMNINSTIPRPENQQCKIINQDWSRIFDHP